MKKLIGIVKFKISDKFLKMSRIVIFFQTPQKKEKIGQNIDVILCKVLFQK